MPTKGVDLVVYVAGRGVDTVVGVVGDGHLR